MMKQIKYDVASIQKYLAYAMVFYVLNKRLFDWFTFGVSKYLYYVIVAAGALLGMLMLFQNKNLRGIVIAFAVYCLIVVVNGVAFREPELLVEGIKTYITFYLPFFTLVFLINKAEDYTGLFRGITYWGAMASFLALHEFIEEEPLLPNFEKFVYTFDNGDTAYRATVFIGSPMILGIALGFAMLISLYFLHVEKKWTYLFLAGMNLMGIICTGSRAPLLFSVFCAALLYYFFFRQNTVSKKFVYGAIAAAVLVVITLAVFAIFPGLSTGIERLDFLIYRITSSFNFSTEWGNIARIRIWKHYIGEFLEQPLFGYGIASTSAMPYANIHKHVWFGDFWAIVTESGVLARLVETGLVGTIAFGAFIFQCAKMYIKKTLFAPQRAEKNTRLFIVSAMIVLFLLEDILLQISLDIFCAFILCFVLAYGIRHECEIEPLSWNYYKEIINKLKLWFKAKLKK